MDFYKKDVSWKRCFETAQCTLTAGGIKMTLSHTRTARTTEPGLPAPPDTRTRTCALALDRPRQAHDSPPGEHEGEPVESCAASATMGSSTWGARRWLLYYGPRVSAMAGRFMAATV